MSYQISQDNLAHYLRMIDGKPLTERRQFLLFTGPLVLFGVVHQNIYENFLLLSVGLPILLNNSLGRMYDTINMLMMFWIVLSLIFVRFMEKRVLFTMCMDSFIFLKNLKIMVALTIFLPFHCRTNSIN